MVEGGQDHLLLDVRARVQFAVCALDGAVNIPLAELEVRATRVFPQLACCRVRPQPLWRRGRLVGQAA